MNKNKKIGWVVAGVLVLVAVFYGGMVYGKSQIPARGQGGVAGAFTRGGAGGGRNGGGGFTAGQIIAKDDKSITVSLMGGGSKIIFFDTNTKISKQTQGSVSDLTVGTQVSITGTPNTDGSVNAQMVQIRPAVPGVKPAQ